MGCGHCDSCPGCDKPEAEGDDKEESKEEKPEESDDEDKQILISSVTKKGPSGPFFGCLCLLPSDANCCSPLCIWCGNGYSLRRCVLQNGVTCGVSCWCLRISWDGDNICTRCC